jgi:hypothetical protein
LDNNCFRVVSRFARKVTPQETSIRYQNQSFKSFSGWVIVGRNFTLLSCSAPSGDSPAVGERFAEGFDRHKSVVSCARSNSTW